MHFTDAELVERALQGDPGGFEEIVRRYQRLVFNIVYHYLGRTGEVEDLAQEIFLKVFRSLDRYDVARPLQHWIGRITANQCLDELRKRKRRKTDLFADLGVEERERLERVYEASKSRSSLSRMEAQECFELLQKAMNRLGDKDRMAFVLREMEGLSYEELAGILQTTELAVRIRVSRARKVLQNVLEKLLQ